MSVQSGLHPVNKLSDATLSSGVYVLTLIKAVSPRSVDLAQVTSGVSADEKKLNARLAISCARRAGTSRPRLQPSMPAGLVAADRVLG